MSTVLELERVPCPLCGADDAAPVAQLRDVAMGVPGEFAVARCRRCGLPPWTGTGRLLDVGCASGRFLAVMKDVVGGLRARQLRRRHLVPFARAHAAPAGRADRDAGWLARDGVMIVEVPNAAGLGGRLFGRYWCGLDFPRHLVHFTPETMTAMVERAGGRVVGLSHRTKPRYVTRSLRHWLRDRRGTASRGALAALDSRVGGGGVKLALEILMAIGRRLGYGEAVRYLIRHR